MSGRRREGKAEARADGPSLRAARVLALAVAVAGLGSCGGGGARSSADGGGGIDVATGGLDARVSDGGDAPVADAGDAPGGTDATASEDHQAAADGASPVDAPATASSAFAVFVTETPPGPGNGNPASWSGVLMFTVAHAGAAFQAAPGIPPSALADPASVVFRAASSELLIGNRHGNNAADGVAGSISRFIFDSATLTLVANGTITGNGLSGVGQVALSPTTGELFAANYGGDISRFTFDAASGAAIPHGTIPASNTRGVLVSPDGKRLYVTSATNQIRQFDLDAGTEATPVTVPGNAQLHFLAWGAGAVYVGGVTDGLVHRLSISATNDLIVRDSFPGDEPISVAFSLDGAEMYSPGHLSSDVVDRYARDDGNDTWTREAATVTVPGSSGGIAVVGPLRPAIVGPPGAER